ncbi:hypothetical protein JRO89_XS13G0012300 [Xanthoceras sorbifolium]|uniref:Uncharacterized protein n=1 Tax=Xanthoceras sorbifolium TaxID=99658 RepID=A0ABQ8H5Y9_9ROSI|nr:hypothetical protein JRO89_XS13G0012300 [Xanthoceras sorbifolium]
MEDSGAILSHISSLKDMLDQVNEEIEANFQITREIESEIVKCAEIETALLVKESELTKILFASQNSVKILEEELGNLRTKRDEMLKRMSEKREWFITRCLEFQRHIDKGQNDELVALLSEKEILEKEIRLLDENINALNNSMLAFAEEILEDLYESNATLDAEIQIRNQENEKLLQDIGDLKSMLLHCYN